MPFRVRLLLSAWLIHSAVFLLGGIWIVQRDGGAGAWIALGLAAGMLSSGWLVWRLSRWMAGIDAAWREVARGRYEAQVPEAARGVFDELTDSFDRVTRHFRDASNRMLDDRDQLRMVLNSMVEGVIAVDAQQRILLLNSAACELFRLKQSTSLGRYVWEVVRHPKLQRWVAQVLETSVPATGDLELLEPAGRMLVVNVARFPASPQPGAVIVVVDVTELRRLEKVRQEFVANASHELKTPLASIKACVEALLDGAADEPRFRQRFLQSIGEQADRLDALVRDMLALARIESAGRTIDTHPVDVESAVQLVVERHRPAAEKKQIAIELSAPEGDPVVVEAEEEALEQIVDNLVDNAVKYTDVGGRVGIAWRAEEGFGVIDVEDTGIGIPQALLPRIFERFYRVDRHRSRDMGGTGLGLSIVKHLVQAMGGGISVTSELHQGSRFTVKLRAASATTAAAKEQASD